ncbi:MAG TPA: hypothetical protein VKE40_28235, partial [Gemmataceae bacterium]|nr:hypothetical protein [Gemmataceae bacterium]
LPAERVEMKIDVTGPGAVATQTLALFNSAVPAPAATGPKPVEPKPKESTSPEAKTPVVVTPPNVVPTAKLVTNSSTPPLGPPEMSAPQVEIAIPGQLRDVCVGGAGRFLLLHCQAVRKLAIFDVGALKIVKTIALGSENVLFAAGADKLLVVYPDEKLIERWSLSTFKIEKEAPLEVRQKPTAAAMGSATAGPLILGGPQAQNNASKMALMFIDVATLKEVWIEKAVGDFGVTFGTAAHLRASPDGRLLGAWFAQLQPSGLQTVQLNGNSMTGAHKRESVGHVVPGHDGKTVFTEKGMFTAAGEPTRRREPVVPAAYGPQFLMIADSPTGEGSKAAPGAKRVTVWEADPDRPVARFDDLPGFDGRRDPFERDNPALSPDKRLFLIARANVLVVVPPAADKLHVYKIARSPEPTPPDPPKTEPEPKKDRPVRKGKIEPPSTGDDILSVTSTPPATAKKGKPYSYQVQVKSQAGGVKYRFNEWATGMTVSPEGLVSWTVPEKPLRTFFDIKLRITDANGHQIEHRWRIDISD